jgi:hypothetical protein
MQAQWQSFAPRAAVGKPVLQSQPVVGRHCLLPSCNRLDRTSAPHGARLPVSVFIGGGATSDAAAAAGASATSLIPQTLEEMGQDLESAAVRDLLKRKGQAALTREERRQRQRSLNAINAPAFGDVLKVRSYPLLCL